MSQFSIARGRKKQVAQFRTWQGVWILALVTLLAVLFFLLMILGILRVDAD
jgi:hypothetical protein